MMKGQGADPWEDFDANAAANWLDLNLTRDHHSVSYKSASNLLGGTAGYVCNHLGPQPTATNPTGLFPTQDEIDKLIDNAVAGKDLVACVAMDYMVATDVNNDQPFVRFFIFGPSGDLLSSVNLDGREKSSFPGHARSFMVVTSTLGSSPKTRPERPIWRRTSFPLISPISNLARNRDGR
jgi:hypothetical protein